MFIPVGGGIGVTVAGLQEFGGWSEVRRIAGPELLSLWKPISDPNFLWRGTLLGAPILGVWYWCTDPFIVQRVLSAWDSQQARRGSIFAGYLKPLPTGLRGVVVAGLLVALMSSLSRVFNSCSTLLWMPFMKQIPGQLYPYL